MQMACRQDQPSVIDRGSSKVQFSLKRLFFIVTISAFLAAVCRVVGLRIILAPVVAAFAFLCAVFYRKIKRLGRDQQSVVVRMCLLVLMLIVLLVGMIGVAVFLALLAGV
jgi:hypothetical protein